MAQTQWRYYNHAVMPNNAPHEEVDVREIEDKSIWNKYPKAIMATWTSDFDCGYDTGWWATIKDGDSFLVDSLSYKSRKSIRISNRNCYVKKIDPAEYAEALAEVYMSAVKKYKVFKQSKKKEDLIRGYQNPKDRVYWGGFERESDKLIGYLTTVEHEDYAEVPAAKYATEYLKLGVSGALHAAILDYYINEQGKKYVLAGFRNIQHVTNVQDYLIRHFDFRNAFVKLHVEINPKYRTLIRFLYSVRGLLRLGILDKIGIIHRINGVLTMKEIADNCASNKP